MESGRYSRVAHIALHRPCFLPYSINWFRITQMVAQVEPVHLISVNTAVRRLPALCAAAARYWRRSC